MRGCRQSSFLGCFLKHLECFAGPDASLVMEALASGFTNAFGNLVPWGDPAW